MTTGETSSPSVAPVPELRYRGPALIERIGRLRRELASWARCAGLPDDEVDALVLACYEALANVVTHAYGNATGPVEVRATRPGHHLMVTITDSGRWRPARLCKDATHGRGLPLIRALAPDAEIEGTAHGTTVRLKWPLPAR